MSRRTATSRSRPSFRAGFSNVFGTAAHEPDMVPMRVRSIAGVVALSFLGAVGACAPKKIELPDPTTAAKFPDFVFPVVPEGLGTPAVLERHNAGWQWLQAGDLRA